MLYGIASAACEKSYTIHSPDRTIGITLTVGNRIAYEVRVDGRTVVAPTPVAMTLDDGTVWGGSAQPSRIRKGMVDTSFATPFYIKKRVADHYNWLRADFRQGFAIELRAYDDGVAYRFISTTDRSLVVASEEAGAAFPEDWTCWVPYVRDCDGTEIVPFGSQFKTSFENLYTVTRLSKLDPARLAFLPLVVAADDGVKLCFTEADLQAYPGMYFNYPGQGYSLRGIFAPYPKRTHDGGHDNLQNVVDEYDNFIAKAAPQTSFPWRTILIAREDRQLLDNDMVMRLAEPSRLEDVSWIRPGLAAWEWWNDWGLHGVGFEAGINTPTYKHYIDFAARNGIAYLVMDDGWSKDKTDLMSGGSDRLDLEEVLRYAKEKDVGIILWAGYRAFDRDMEEVCRHYSALGVKGFKVDFMDRDDQQIAEFLYRGAATAAKYGLLLDYHGIYKPAGLQRTYPNVVNFEGIFGLEQLKWTDKTDADMPAYDCTFPFIRQVAGPVDYTQGAMRNASRKNFRAVNNHPMSQGTRAHQVATYVVFDSPLVMLCDSPTAYEKEPETLDYIVRFPTRFDQTLIPAGEIGRYIVTARRAGDRWYLGALTNWDAREVEVKLDFLGDGRWKARIFRDGVNADRYGEDYLLEERTVTAADSLAMAMAPGGGYAVQFERVQ